VNRRTFNAEPRSPQLACLTGLRQSDLVVLIRDPQQIDFVAEVQAWEGGLFHGGFSTVSDLRISLTRALHDYELANAVGPVDHEEIVARALAMLPSERRSYSSEGATLNLSVAGGPAQSIIRPIELEKPALADALHQKALFGERRLFDLSMGADRKIDGDTHCYARSTFE
jgi:hypothetical protein